MLLHQPEFIMKHWVQPMKIEELYQFQLLLWLQRMKFQQYCHPSLLKESHSDFVKYKNLGKAGHFLAFEEPDIVANDIIDFLRILKERKP